MKIAFRTRQGRATFAPTVGLFCQGEVVHDSVRVIGTVETSGAAPTLRVEGRVAGEGALRVVFHLPLPPLPAAGMRAVHAIERRAKNAYFTVLDAMRTGMVDAENRAQLRRLAAQVRARARVSPVSDAFESLVAVMAAITTGMGGIPMVPQLERPLGAVVIGLTAGPILLPTSTAMLAELLRWPLEWLRTRGLIVARGLEIRWAPQG